MSAPIQPPSSAIKAVCDDCDVLIEAYLEGLKQKPHSIGRYESEVEFFTLMKLMLRHLESLTVLAREDLVLAPSAHLIARTIFETSVRARWMFVPIDPYEREVRWILFLRSGTTQARKIVKSEHTSDARASAYENMRSDYAKFDTAICKLLTERDYEIPKQAPNIWEMLKELKESHLYNSYVLLSAYTHSNFEAASLYKRGLGGAKEIGEFTSVSDWVLPFEVSWKSFFLAGRDFLEQIEADVPRFKQAADIRAFERRLKEITKA